MYLINPENINEDNILDKINKFLIKNPDLKILSKDIDIDFLCKINANIQILDLNQNTKSNFTNRDNIQSIDLSLNYPQSKMINSKKHTHFFQDEIFENSFRMLSKPEINSVKLAAFAVDNKIILYKDLVLVLLGEKGIINSGIALKAAGKQNLLQTRIVEKIFQPYF